MDDYTTPPFSCKYFCNLLCPILTAAEGFLLVGAKMFTVAGPVIIYDTAASVV
ncbi:MAG: hypothetical protein IJY82_05635 [Oscillospiraceae bacterium]|nr:hypothetical protein [Oscillospiraceae bacterium]